MKFLPYQLNLAVNTIVMLWSLYIKALQHGSFPVYPRRSKNFGPSFADVWLQQTHCGALRAFHHGGSGAFEVAHVVVVPLLLACAAQSILPSSLSIVVGCAIPHTSPTCLAIGAASHPHCRKVRSPLLTPKTQGSARMSNTSCSFLQTASPPPLATDARSLWWVVCGPPGHIRCAPPEPSRQLLCLCSTPNLLTSPRIFHCIFIPFLSLLFPSFLSLATTEWGGAELSQWVSDGMGMGSLHCSCSARASSHRSRRWWRALPGGCHI
jgi:hypothetical protein